MIYCDDCIDEKYVELDLFWSQHVNNLIIVSRTIIFFHHHQMIIEENSYLGNDKA